MTVTRNAKGQFVKKTIVVDHVAEMSKIINTKVSVFSDEVYGKVTKKTMLKAYRSIFSVDYLASYDWFKSSGIKF